jgi:hypothetical protein
MEFIINIDLNDLLKKVNIKLDKFDELIKSKKKELVDIENFRKDILKEKNDIIEKINKVKKEKKLKLQIEKEKKNTNYPSIEEMEDNSPSKIHEYKTLVSSLKKEHKDEDISYDLKDCNWFEENSFKFGDILDTSDHRHYGYTFVGKNGLCENTTRINSVNHEEGITVPINISKYLTNTVLKYSNYKWDESCILAYELPYYDVTVQKYNVKKGHMYEYVCWNYKKEQYNTSKWYLEQIDIKTGERTKPKKKRVKKKN